MTEGESEASSSQSKSKNTVTVDGKKVPAKMLAAYVAEPTYEEIRWIAYQEHSSIQQVLRKAVSQYIASREPG